MVTPFFEALSEGYFSAVTSTITLLEVLVHPYRCGDRDIAQKYREILLYSDNLITFPVSKEIADGAAEIRAKYGIRVPDAIQIATALHEGASGFLTNDRNLRKIQEIDIVTLVDVKQPI